MICVIKLNELKEITGWIIASDLLELQRKAQAAFQLEVAESIRKMTLQVRVHKYEILPNVFLLLE